jgi:hypothetical protein
MFWVIVALCILIYVFEWWTIPIIILFFILVICFTHSGSTPANNNKKTNHKANNNYNTSNTPHKPNQSIHPPARSASERKPGAINPAANVTNITPVAEPSIIDITPKTNPSKSTGMEGQIIDVPYWEHQYIYSYSEINQASHIQRQFYFRFRKKFLNGECLDLNGNINYAFILLFDLLNDYDKFGNIAMLEIHLKLLGLYYPKTKSYANSFLIQRMKKSGDNESAERIWEEEHDYWKLGSKHKDELNLNRKEVKHLNKLYYTSNKFNSIGFCMSEIIKLYCSVLKELENKCVQEGATIESEITSAANLILQKRHPYLQDNERKYRIDSIVGELYTFVFKHCENAVRECYGYKTKLHISLQFESENQTAYKTEFISNAIGLIPVFTPSISLMDTDKEKMFYANLTGLWKTRMKELKRNYNNDSKHFFDSVIRLSELNSHSSESIFYDATTFMLKHDRETTIKLYFYYLNISTNNYKILTGKRLHALIVNQNWEEAVKILKNDHPVLLQIYELNTKIINSLFNNKEQVDAFKEVLRTLVWGKNLDEAVSCVPSIYRKKIQVDNKLITEVQQRHAESVAILNEYLKDESEDENNIIDSTEVNIGKTEADTGDIGFSQIQLATLFLFTENNLSVLQCDMEAFAKSRGVLKNQLVESINELCYESLDDVLIDEDDKSYTINPDYYQKVLAK